MLVTSLRRAAAAVRKIGCPVALVVRIEGDKGPVMGSLCRYASVETTATAIEKKPRSTASFPDRTSMLAIEQVASMLEVFRGLHHHVNVPKAFVVPTEEPWPHELHGERLGIRIDYLRRMKDRLSPTQLRQLDSVGMVWSDEEYQVGRIERGLTTYKAMYGDVRVPQAFEVPHGDDRWDRDLWDMKLGRTINVVRNTGAYKAYRSRFEALGLTFDRWNGPQYPFTVLRQALETFYAQYGHYEVPTTYVVAEDDTAYAAEVRGMTLGEILTSIIHKEVYAEHRAELEAMGVPLKPRKELNADRICEAVRCYRRAYGEGKRIPKAFVVPEGSSLFPREMWGLRLGAAVYNICKQGGYANYRDDFEAVGLTIEKRSPLDHQLAEEKVSVVARLLPVFRQLHHHANVPKAFVVPTEEPWPHELHGERLGIRIDYLRRMKDRLSPAQLRQLDSVGMVWSDEEYQVGRIERGLTTYKAMYGDVRVPYQFVVPHGDDRWDRDLWDMKLGRTINVVRNTGAYEAYRSRFEALGLTFDRWNGPPFTVVQKERAQHGHYEVSMAEAGDTWGTVWASTKRYVQSIEQSWRRWVSR